MNFTDMIKFHKGRIAIINATHVKSDDNWQSNATPIEIVDKMISKTKLDGKDILVMFNLEFLERLIYDKHVHNENLYFLADTEVEKRIAEKIYNVKSIVVTEPDLKTKQFITKVSQMKFDLVFSNPPYNGNIDLKILQQLKPIAKEMIVVHPSTWLIDLKGKNKLYNDFKNDLKLKSVEMFNGNPVFGIGLNVPCSITHIDNTHKGKNINVKMFNDEYKVTSIDDITKYGKDWTYTVKPFMQTIKSYIDLNGNVWNNKIETMNDRSKFFVQLAAIVGTRDSSSSDRMVKDDFYTIVMKNSDGNRGIRKEFSNTSGVSNMPTYEFSIETEQTNFINYLKTDFARFCLSMYKIQVNNHRGELEIIPWMDFTQEWNDEKLFSHFEIDQETQDYIRSFLPDYHGIRK